MQFFSAMRAGARGHLLKDAEQNELVRAVQAVSRSEAFFSPTIARLMMHYFSALSLRASALAFTNLTEREQKILHLIAQGSKKLQVVDRSQAITLT